MDALPAWEPIQPQGVAAALLGVTIPFTILIITVVGLRMWVRFTRHALGVEDYLMCIGLALNLVHNAFVLYGSFTGLGSPDSKLTNPATAMEAGKVVVFWQIFYVNSSTFIKGSICATLIRIATNRLHINIVYGLIIVTVLSNTTAWISVLIRCKPVAASWNPSLGSCLDQTIIVTLTYVVSVVNILTDWGTAILPMFILWNVQMRRKVKLATGGILGVGILASCATIIRMPYSSAYTQLENQLEGIGNIVLWTVVECDLGIIAGCLPMLRQLFKSLKSDSSRDKASAGTPQYPDIITIGQRSTGKQNRSLDMELQVTCVGGGEDGEGESQKDDESTSRIIKVTKRFEQTRTGGYSQM